MTWIRIDDHRLNVDAIVSYRPALLIETQPQFKTQIEKSNGESIYVTATPEEVDQMIGINTPKK